MGIVTLRACLLVFLAAVCQSQSPLITVKNFVEGEIVAYGLPLALLIQVTNFPENVSSSSGVSVSVNVSCPGSDPPVSYLNVFLETGMSLEELTGIELDVSHEIMENCRGGALTFDMSAASESLQTSMTFSLSVEGTTASVLWVVFAVISIVACLGLISLYIKFPPFRRFPSNLIFWRTLVDLVFALQFVVFHARRLESLDDNEACTPTIAFFTQFCLSASLNWYMVLALNFYFSMSNPFRRPQAKNSTYHVAVWSFSLLSGVMAATRAEYRADFELCWFKRSTATVNVYSWLFYFVWLFIFLILGIGISVLGHYKLRQKHTLDKTLAKRKEALKSLQVYVIVYSVYWAVMALVYLYVNIYNRGIVMQNRSILLFLAVWSGLLGTIDVLTWLFVQWQSEQQVVDDDFDDISDALRYEFIHCTSEGIQLAVRQHDDDVATGVSKPYDPKMLLKQVEDSINALSLHPPAQRPASPTADNFLQRRSVEVSTKNLSAPYGFVSYAPALFAEARRICGVSSASFLQSMSGDPTEMKQNFSEGRSGSFFYFSVDRRVMVKTMTKQEFRLLLKILASYISYFRANPNTLLCRFLGLYSIVMHGHREYFVVMHNCLRSDDPSLAPSEVYDLKGSSIARYTATHTNGKRKARPGVLKDNNLSTKVVTSPDYAKVLVEQAELDTLFLRGWQIMDYSLLLGIHYCTSRHQHNTCFNDPTFNPTIRAPDSSLAGQIGAGASATAASLQVGGNRKTHFITASSPHSSKQEQERAKPDLEVTVESDHNKDEASIAAAIMTSPFNGPRATTSTQSSPRLTTSRHARLFTKYSKPPLSGKANEKSTSPGADSRTNSDHVSLNTASSALQTVVLPSPSPTAARSESPEFLSAPSDLDGKTRKRGLSAQDDLAGEHRESGREAGDEEDRRAGSSASSNGNSKGAEIGMAVLRVTNEDDSNAGNVEVKAGSVEVGASPSFNRQLDPASSSVRNGGVVGQLPTEEGKDEVAPSRSLAMAHYSSAIVGPGVYYMGIIDILQEWTLKKKLELILKIVFKGHCFDYQELSVADPDFYATRFIYMFDGIIDQNCPV